MPDYANPQSLNRYSYVMNNPLRYTDPTGHYIVPTTGVNTQAICGMLGDNVPEQYRGTCGFHTVRLPLFMGGSTTGTLAVSPAQAILLLGLTACTLTPCDELIREGLYATGHAFAQGVKELGCNGLFCVFKSGGGEDADQVDDETLGRILGKHGAGAGMAGKSEFPEEWTGEEVREAIEEVAQSPDSTRTIQGNAVRAVGSWTGVRIRVIKYGGKIQNAYPIDRPLNP